MAKQTKAEQRDLMMAKLIAIGREIFAERGYAHTAAEEIVSRAGVTRGALYHHFDGKEGLFAAVLEGVQRDVAASVAAAAAGEADLWSQLRAGCQAFLASSLDPTVQRIMLIDGPAVLGWQRWREMDAQHSMRLLADIVEALIADGVIRRLPVMALTHLLSGAMNEASLWIAQSENPQAALDEAQQALGAVLDGLRL